MPLGKWYTVVDFITPGSETKFCIASFGKNLAGAFDANHEICKMMRPKELSDSYIPDGNPHLLNIIHQGSLPQA